VLNLNKAYLFNLQKKCQGIAEDARAGGFDLASYARSYTQKSFFVFFWAPQWGFGGAVLYGWVGLFWQKKSITAVTMPIATAILNSVARFTIKGTQFLGGFVHGWPLIFRIWGGNPPEIKKIIFGGKKRP
jgi:hypothetical protein